MSFSDRSGSGLDVKSRLTSGGWVPFKPGGDACPICGKHSNCKTTQDRGLVYCGRVDSGPTFLGKINGGGQALHRVGSSGLSREFTPSPPPPPRDPRAAAAQAALCQAHPDADRKRAELAARLGVSVESLRRLGVGWSPVFRRRNGTTAAAYWSFPERDDKGRVIGVNRRFEDGSKKLLYGGSRGLYLPEGWAGSSGPVFVVEGGSDSATLLDLGLPVIGLPGAGQAGELVTRVLEMLDPDRPIVIIGEDDRLKDGKPRPLPPTHKPTCSGCRTCWPGKAAAIHLAGRLVASTGRVVRVVLPGQGAKDSRSWLQHAGAGSREELRDRFVASLLPVKEFTPPPVYRPEGTDSEAELVTLEDWRGQMLRSRQASTPGVGEQLAYLDRSPTGTGKTFADGELLRERGSGLILLPTHANAGETVADLVARGVSAVAFPERRTEDAELGSANCWNEYADWVEDLGLPVLSVACPRCPHRQECEDHNSGGYLGRLAEARDADIAVATHARGSFLGLEDLAGKREYIAIHEDPSDLFRPSQVVGLADIEAAAAILNWGLTDPVIVNAKGRSSKPVLAALGLLASATTQLLTVLRSAGESGPVEVGKLVSFPKGFLVVLADLLPRARRAGVVTTIPGKGAWRVILGSRDRKDPARLSVCVEVQPDGVTTRKLLAVWQRSIPAGKTVWVGDATLGAEELGDLLPGVTVIDATPPGRLAQRKGAVQIPRDLTRQAGESRRKTGKGRSPVQDLLSGVLADRPEAKRVGVITHRPHVPEVRELMEAGGVIGERIARVEYWGSGKERSDNSWHRDCDLVVILGTPRPGGEAVRLELLRAGELVAARVQTPAWGPLVWEGLGQDGERVIVQARGYLDPVWQAAHRRLVRSSLRQGIGRGRGLLESGIPVVVVTNEECGLVLSDRGAADLPLPDPTRRVLACLEEMLSPAKRFPDMNPTETYVGCVSGNLTGVSTGDIVKRMRDMTDRTVRRHLSVLELRGMVIRRGGSRNTTWSLVAADPPVEDPKPKPSPAAEVPDDDDGWFAWAVHWSDHHNREKAAVETGRKLSATPPPRGRTGQGGGEKPGNADAEPPSGSATYSGVRKNPGPSRGDWGACRRGDLPVNAGEGAEDVRPPRGQGETLSPG